MKGAKVSEEQRFGAGQVVVIVLEIVSAAAMEWSSKVFPDTALIERRYRVKMVAAAVDPLPVVTGLTPGQTYAIYASATNAGGESELSDPVTATVSAAAA